jgi:hypothetical protein
LWNPNDAGNETEYLRANKLIVKQILLGVEAKPDEYNVVEVMALCTEIIDISMIT